MKPSTVDYLCCPDCLSALQLQDAARQAAPAAEIESGQLLCTGCHNVFPVIAGIPRFVSNKLSGKTDIHTGKRFAESWKEFSHFDQRYEKQFFDWIAPVSPSFVKDKLILEAGCGKGRHTQIVAANGASQVFAVDIGEAVEVAYKNAGLLPNVHVIQADIKRMPFKRQFDYAFSVGVLHHMEKPEEGFESVCSKVRDKGHVSIWVYGRENNWWITHIIDPIRIALTSKLPAPVLKALCYLPAAALRLACMLIYRPWALLKKRFAFLPNLYYQDYLSYIWWFDQKEMHSLVFDHLVAPVAYYLPEHVVRSWFARSLFTQFCLRWHNKNSWSAFGRVEDNTCLGGSHKQRNDAEWLARSPVNCRSTG